MPLEIRGFDELSNDLSAMAAALSDDGPVINKALKAGAVPIEEQMRMNASSDPKIITGDLYSSIHTHGVKHKKGGSGKHITIGVKHSEKGAFYSEPLEYGNVLSQILFAELWLPVLASHSSCSPLRYHLCLFP